MQHLESHLQGAFSTLQVSVVDNPPPGHANARYDLSGFDTAYNPAAMSAQGMPARFTRLPIFFHTGDVQFDAPMNGVTVESLLNVCSHRLNSLQNTPEQCSEFAMAREYIDMAMAILARRQATQNTSAFTFGGMFNRAAASISL